MPVTPEQVGFPAASQIVRIHRRFTPVNPSVANPTRQPQEESQFYITALPAQPDIEANAQYLLAVCRGHWTIENGNHYSRDRSYDEDRCPVRHANAAHILATLRSMARFLTKIGVHRPTSVYQKTVPALNRYCNAHRRQAAKWFMDSQKPL